MVLEVKLYRMERTSSRVDHPAQRPGNAYKDEIGQHDFTTIPSRGLRHFGFQGLLETKKDRQHTGYELHLNRA